ncbi:MAG: hypothetical protein L0Y38_11120 [Methylococcaceae bacterium]|nr:hypothetical protein [Methylococcaceae bacterium]MCI0666945.1 hypothetical protein [Methylococcaceae bacterium]MCI0734355.1 hypothetical protein [Methylococcaceae bacterium]
MGPPDSTPVWRLVDQRLVHDEIIGRCGSDALALYLFLITVADAKGPSWYIIINGTLY